MGRFNSPQNVEILPVHIGIIMDGNGRWAQKRGLPRSAGHREGAKVFRKTVEYAEKRGIKYLTFYAFSTENWARPQDEIDAIMDLLRSYLKEAFSDKNKPRRTHFIGDINKLDADIYEMMKDIEARTSNVEGITVNIAVNYGGRQEITNAIKLICNDVIDKKMSIDDINEKTISNFIYTKSQPDPDLIIRPSGEFRLSNFLIWQAAYSEFVFMQNVLWPDFKPKHFDMAIEEYNKRNRRYGGL